MVANGSHTVGDDNTYQTGAVIEIIMCAEFCYCVGDDDGFQVLTTTKGRITNYCNFCRNYKSFTIACRSIQNKACAINAIQHIINCLEILAVCVHFDFCQVIAVYKCIICNLSYTCGNGYACKATTVKCSIFDIVCIGYGYIRQVGASGKCIVKNKSSVVENCFLQVIT